MSFGNILGQIFQDGLGQSPQARNRVANAGQNLEAGGGGIEGIFGQIQQALAGAGANAAGTGDAGGGLADRARDFLREEQVAGLSGGQAAGIGALAGALLGGGLKGAARGGTLAVLGTLAVSALRNAQAQQGAGAPAAGLAPEEVRALTAADTEKLILQAMISAAKVDGKIDGAEMDKVVQRLAADEVTEDEKRFVAEELRKPIDIAGLAAQVRLPAQAAQVYAATLFTIHVDTPEEQAYLRNLAQALGLDAGTVAELHRLTGAPV